MLESRTRLYSLTGEFDGDVAGESAGGGVRVRGVEDWVLKRLSALSIERFTWRCFLDEQSVVEDEGPSYRYSARFLRSWSFCSIHLRTVSAQTW
jgi:hypothetical protein